MKKKSWVIRIFLTRHYLYYYAINKMVATNFRKQNYFVNSKHFLLVNLIFSSIFTTCLLDPKNPFLQNYYCYFESRNYSNFEPTTNIFLLFNYFEIKNYLYSNSIGQDSINPKYYCCLSPTNFSSNFSKIISQTLFIRIKLYSL